MEKEKQLMALALEALPNSYAPYSHFHVAAALLSKDGTIYIGNNMENASYPAGLCAERSAYAKAISDGKREFTAIAICGGPDGKVKEPCPPCGICRQVMREFGNPEEFQIILGTGEGDLKVYTLQELLPESFGPDHQFC
ncbi:MAG: cytidine deaminase [Lachnospiraceae bacterium]